MPCERFEIRGGGHGFICSRRRKSKLPSCSVCGRPGASRLCDGTLDNGQSCDVPLCLRCSIVGGGLVELVGGDCYTEDHADYCPSCYRRTKSAPRQLGLFALKGGAP